MMTKAMVMVMTLLMMLIGNRSEEEEQEGYDNDGGHDAADVADDDFLGQDENP